MGDAGGGEGVVGATDLILRSREAASRRMAAGLRPPRFLRICSKIPLAECWEPR
jgi:hypothetical protein